MPVSRLPLAASLACVVPFAPAFAQDAGEAPAAAGPAARTTVYDRAFFAQYAPTSALDIARRVPGFNLETGNADVRGFSGAAGNVVFNGARPSSKLDSLETLLQRIPASRVLRVELGPGDLYGADYAAKSQVLNVILTADGGIDGNVTASLKRIFTGDVIPNLEGSVLYKRGNFSANLAAGSGQFDYVEEGFDRITNPATGAQREFRRKVNDIRPHNPYVSAAIGVENAADRAFHLNGRFSPNRFLLLQTNRVIPAIGPVRDDRLIQDYDNDGIEVGGDITRPLGGGALKFVALANRRERETYDAYFNRVNAAVTGGFEQLSNSSYQETLGRLTWSKARLLGMSVEIGSEVAFNRLENATDLFGLGAGGGRTRIDLPIDQATVQEWRTDSHVNAGRELTKGVRLDLGLAYETSRLTVSGDADAKRSLQFFKPSATFDFKPGGGWHGQLIARRTVAQLDFFDFLSNAELANDRVNGGNSNLEPQRAWEFRGMIEHPLLKTGVAKLELGYDRVSKLQDRILTPEGFDAPGNLGTGTRLFAQATLDAPLDKLGLKGFRFTGNGTIQRTRVTDPLTGRPRDWSGFWADYNWSVELRKDASNWAAGVAAFGRGPFAFYRTDEIDSNFNGGVFMTAFAEFRPDKRTMIRLDVENLTDTTGERNRDFFDPDRSVPLPFANEYRLRNQHVIFTLSIRRGFGGSAKG